MADKTKALYGTGTPGSGGLERLTKSKEEGEAAETYARTRRMAEKKAMEAKIKNNMSTEVFKLNPVERALHQVTK